MNTTTLSINADAFFPDGVFCWNYCSALLREFRRMEKKNEHMEWRPDANESSSENAKSWKKGDKSGDEKGVLFLTPNAYVIIHELWSRIPKLSNHPNHKFGVNSEGYIHGCDPKTIEKALCYCEWYLGIFKK